MLWPLNLNDLLNIVCVEICTDNVYIVKQVYEETVWTTYVSPLYIVFKHYDD